MATDHGIKIQLVYLKEPCTACVIIGDAIKEILDKVQKECSYEGIEVDIEMLELEDLKQVRFIEGLEVEKFPALLINGEQITAGNIPSKKQLMTTIKSIKSLKG
ncbi:Thioredoxin domain-containing protein [Caldanaerobius fijiensis DSM 17918]|uniref:Thioredoxin domain-containing protein n=1 Tax=Caldanaerobius fijiensis DSM 17918 TaxID=1121256 RepID=A0A1M5F6I5_9THEO|nr:thioredoxin family protein [Caldanaerobius fijiensis]SHF87146.1 Thioredoxin domain-containing protein [Caldanaerobius fijiensis DSM 17918]